MNPELTNKAAYDLALEYTRQNNLLCFLQPLFA